MTDLYFLLRYLLNRPDTEHPWLFERCREVEEAPNGYLDLWSREHYKSTIITFAKTIQDILASHGEGSNGKEWTFGILSFNRPTAVKFLSQIKQEFERNVVLKELFTDVLWQDPDRQAAKWSVYSGLLLQRARNPREATVEAYGLVDGMPTSAHFDALIYDDVVTVDMVRSPEMIEKVTEAYELSVNLGARGGFTRMIGTRYHYADTYKSVMDRGAYIPRIHVGADPPEEEGEALLLTLEEWRKKRRDMGPYTFSAQMLQEPGADKAQGFQEAWLRYYNEKPAREKLNVYLLVDPANEKKKKSDYTAMLVVGVGADENYYLLDGFRDRLNLTERTRRLMDLHRQYKPNNVGYEKYGKDSDIEHIETEMERNAYRFEIQELGGQQAKNDRIRRLVPIFEQHRMWFPVSLNYTDYEKKTRDLVREIREDEYKPFPIALHDDLMDCLARILDEDMDVQFPAETNWDAPLEIDTRYVV
jgi:predicted phage terminase large subunit-like protein